MAKNDFFKKLKSAEQALEKAKAAKRSGGMIDVEDGTYIVRLQRATADVNDKGVPYVLIDTRVVHSPASETAVGSRIGKYHNIAPRSGNYKSGPNKGEKYEITVEDCLADLCKDLQSFGVDTNDLDGMEDLEACLEQLGEENPACRVQVKTKGDYQNVYFGKFVDDESLPSLEEVLGDDAGDDDGESEEEVEGDGEEDGTDEEETDLKEGDEVAVRLKGSKRATSCTVTGFDDDGGIIVTDAKGNEHTVTEGELIV